jgi:transposase
MYYIGIDVSSKESALCILDGKGKIVRETKLPTDPEVIARFVAATGLAIERIGLESGCTAAWLFAGLRRHGWPVTCIGMRSPHADHDQPSHGGEDAHSETLGACVRCLWGGI